jgi:outer membrane protein OmpA-like peptidoglycan-associated protein
MIVISLLISITFSGCLSEIASSIKKDLTKKEETVSYHSDKPVLMFILDGSGSMNSQDSNGIVKINSARDTISDIVGQLNKQKVNLGLISFNKGCNSAKLLVSPENNDFSKVVSITNNLNPAEKTPLAEAIKKAGKVLKDIDKKVRIIVISDGAETCGGNPSVEAKKLTQKYGIDVKIYVVGYGVDNTTKNQLEAVATAGNGKYFGVENANNLNQIVNEIIAVEDIRLDNFSHDGSIYTFHINFDTGLAKIKTEFLDDIEKFANYLSHNNYTVQIQGHTDSQASKSYNQKLSERRAKSVVDKLKSYGISDKRLQYIGYGEEFPIATNSTVDGRYQNRRVEAHINK